MKISFAGVFLDHVIDRLGDKTVATSYFRSSKVGQGAARILGYDIELDPETGLVTVAVENDRGAAVIVPRERVKRFETFPPPKVADLGDDAHADDDGDDAPAGIDAPADAPAGIDARADGHDGDDSPADACAGIDARAGTDDHDGGARADDHDGADARADDHDGDNAPGTAPAPGSTPAPGTLLPSEASELTPKPLRRLGR